ncbi:MAG: WG repeat-containing protein [Phaeodactylibacter sp.]|nr:WG repeat-containing protein [Phaeodactylibacter sp.]
MKTIHTLFLIALPFLLFSQNNRYVIFENFRYGFIDGEGEVVIQPRFRNVSFFSQGLAPAREEAYWGFIDTLGRWAIKPKYDYASPFVDGLARVYRNGQECWMDTEGGEWNSDTWHRRKLDEFGVVRQEEGGGMTLHFDGQELSLPPGDNPGWKQGAYIAIERFATMPDGQRKILFGVIDTSGQVAVPFGKFGKVWPFFQGRALASRYDTAIGRSDYFLIDTAGEFIRAVARSDSQLLNISPGPDGRLFSATYQNEKGQFCHNLLNRKGEWLLERDTMVNIQPLGYGLAAVHYRTPPEYWLANEQGLCCTEAPLQQLRPFSRAANSRYLYGREASGNWVRFDTNGVEAPASGLRVLDTIEGAQLYGLYCGNLATFGIKKKGEPARIGLLHTEKGLLLPPVYQEILPQCRGEKLSNSPTVIAVKKDGVISYLREDGEPLWQSGQLPEKKLLPYDVDERVPMTYEVRCTFKMSWWLRLFTGKTKFFRAWYFKRPFQKQYRSYNLYLMNDGPDTLVLSARNMGQLSIHLEAQDEQGEWRRIDQCVGCDMVAVNAVKRLPPGHFWAFRVPKMEGAIPTKLRYVATYSLPKEVTPPRADTLPDGRQVRYPVKLKGERKLYSRTFRGGVNPAQFHPEYGLWAPGPFIREWMAGE